ncbi:hypothetical protein ACH5RR_018089 [Cinchona calisaya]|uniref:Uncharacterized protein n=1 Tax=Cinchona calisaya TaxID=153742 RepID=A0ABD2ZNL8_9GENT
MGARLERSGKTFRNILDDGKPKQVIAVEVKKTNEKIALETLPCQSFTLSLDKETTTIPVHDVVPIIQDHPVEDEQNDSSYSEAADDSEADKLMIQQWKPGRKALLGPSFSRWLPVEEKVLFENEDRPSAGPIFRLEPHTVPFHSQWPTSAAALFRQSTLALFSTRAPRHRDPEHFVMRVLCP